MSLVAEVRIDDSKYPQGLSFMEVNPHVKKDNLHYGEIKFVRCEDDKQNKISIQKLVKGQMYQVDQPKTGKHFTAPFERGLISTSYPNLYFCNDESLYVDVYFGDVTVKAV